MPLLTERQEQLLTFIRNHQGAQGVPPSMREIARQFDCSQPTVHQHLQALAKKGEIEKLSDGKWGLAASTMQALLFQAPLYGSIPAGLPAMREQEPERMIGVDLAFFGLKPGKAENVWLLRVQGDSMEGARIFDGDVVALVRRQPVFGEIIAALVDETTVTLKRMVREKGRTILRAENPKYADIVPARLESQGVVIGVLRNQLA